MIAAQKRSCIIVNLDPAAESLPYTPAIDIRDLVSVDETMKELDLGPNGGLVAAMEVLAQPEGLSWLGDRLDESAGADDDYVIFDCPGQLELYLHINAVRKVIDYLTMSKDFQVASVFCIDSLFANESKSKLVAGFLASLTAMMHLGTAYIGVLTKADLYPKVHKEVRPYLLNESTEEDEDDKPLVTEKEDQKMTAKHQRLIRALESVLENSSLVGFHRLNINDEDSIAAVVEAANEAMGYGESLEPRDTDFDNDVEPSS